MNLNLLIPTYNRSALLKRCLDSIEQATKPIDLILTVVVIDNNSNDDTPHLVHAFAGQSTFAVKYLFVGRCGKSAALNDALALADAELIGLIDDDEQIDRTWFEVVFREFSSAPTLDFIGGPYLPDWEQPPPAWLPPTYPGVLGIVPRPHRTAFSRDFPGILMGGNAVIRRATLQKVLPYPEDLGKLGSKIRSGEDEVIYHRLLERNATGHVVPDLIIHHWIPAERLTRQYHRRWVIGRGISLGAQLRDRGLREPGFLGIPRYQVGAALRGVRAMLAGSPCHRFAGQLAVLDCLATLYGRHFYGSRSQPHASTIEC